MRSYRKWVLSLGLAAAVAPGMAFAGPFSFGRGGETAATSNQQTAENVAEALRAAKLAGFDIDIEVKEGVCTLSGKIGSAEQKERASKAVGAVPGVRRVDNRLSVSGGEIQQAGGTASKGGIERASFKGAAQRPAAGPNNQVVAENIAKAIKQSGIRGHNLDLKFADGVAVLDGQVAQPQHVAQLTQVVSRVPGVRQVDNRLSAPGMRPAKTGNQAVAENVAGALAQAGLSSSDIEVRYNNGVATLRGVVGHPQAAGAAEEIASQVPGVQSVNNQIQVAGRGPGAPIQQVNFQQEGGMPPMAPGAPMGPAMAQPMHAGRGPSHMAYDMPNLPQYSWPAYSPYPNYAALQYPTQYSASAWPYIGPFYPYPQVPLGWRKASLEWDDGYWNLSFNSRTDKWFWFLDSKNW